MNRGFLGTVGYCATTDRMTRKVILLITVFLSAFVNFQTYGATKKEGQEIDPKLKKTLDSINNYKLSGKTDSAILVGSRIYNIVRTGNYSTYEKFITAFSYGHACWQKYYYHTASDVFSYAVSIADSTINNKQLSIASNMLGACYQEIGDADLALISYRKGYEIANSINDQTGMQQSLISKIDLFNNMKFYDKSIETANRSIKLAIDNKDTISEALATDILGQTMALDGNRQKAIEMFLKSLSIIEKVDTMTKNNIMKRYILEIKTDIYSNLASAYSVINNNEKAEYYFDLCRESFRKLKGGTIIDYSAHRAAIEMALAKGDYKRALRIVNRVRDMVVQNDNIYTKDAGRLYQYSAKAYYGLKNYKKAYESLETYKQIEDSLISSDARRRSLDRELMGGLQKKNAVIYQKDTQVKRQRFFIGLIVGTSALLITTLLVVIISLQRINQANKSAFKNIEQLRESKVRIRENARERINNDTSSDEERLFIKIDDVVRENGLFRSGNLSRKDVAARVASNETYVANSVRIVTGCTFTEYINQIRLDYACQLMKNDKNMTIDSVSTASGFSSSRTFYRLFKERFGLTPAQYTKAAHT